MEQYTLGKTVTRKPITKKSVAGKISQRKTPIKGQLEVGSGKNDQGLNSCAAPGSIPTRSPLIREEINRNVFEASKREAALPELVIIENIITIMSYEQLVGTKEKPGLSVCEIENDNVSGPGSINDARMGVTESGNPCQTCRFGVNHCPGHLGHMIPPIPIYHPFYYKEIMQILSIVCHSCSGLLARKADIKESGITKYNFKTRLEMLEKTVNAEEVPCQNIKTKATATTSRKRNVGEIRPCSHNPKLINKSLSETGEVQYEKADGSIGAITVDRVIEIMEAISDEDARFMGFNTQLGARPVNFILRAIAVTPPITRFSTMLDGALRQHPHTEQYMKIAKKILAQKSMIAGSAPDKETKIAEARRDLAHALRELFEGADTSSSFPGAKVKKGIKTEIQGKRSAIRGSIMGTRNNYVARTVIGMDPTLKFGQLRVPKAFASYLTQNETVYQYNLESLQNLVDEKEVIEYDPELRKNIKVIKRQATHIIRRAKNKDRMELRAGLKYKLEIGDIVQRYLRNGDMIMFGRQPTLHKQSLMAYEVVLGDQLTFGIHPSYTTPLNAD